MPRRPFEIAAVTIAPDEAAKSLIQSAILKHNLLLPAAGRNAWRRVAALVAPYAAVAAAIAWAFLPGSFEAFADDEIYLIGLVALAFGGFQVWKFAWQPVDSLHRQARAAIMPELFGFLGNVAYANGGKPEFLGRIPKAALVAHTSADIDDRLSGTIDGCEFELAECNLWVGSGKSKHLEFSGVAFRFALDERFPGTLVATRQLGVAEKVGRALFGGDTMTEITLDDAGEAKRFRVRSDAPDAAVAVLNAGLEKVLAFLADTWPAGVPRLALAEGEGFLLLSTKHNHFEVPYGQSIRYDAHVAPMLHELEMLLSSAVLVRQALAAKGKGPDGPVSASPARRQSRSPRP
jgi:hypothetical protein